jgi:Transglycosylase SLT domain
MGTAYLADKIKEFGEPHLALASYNAGERAVRRWVDSRGDLGRDEFIDDIPYPETQNYVKRVLATSDDYRHLYADDKAELEGVDVIAVKASTAGSSSTTKAPAAASPKARPAPKRATKPRKSA